MSSTHRLHMSHTELVDEDLEGKRGLKVNVEPVIGWILGPEKYSLHMSQIC